MIHAVLFLIAVTSWQVPVSSARAAEKPANDRPSMLIILVDDLGYGDLSSYGATDLQTPNIDALVRRGMKFENFYANCPVCSPTRAALLTGRYQDMVGVPGVIRTHADNNWGYLSPDAVLLPKSLKPAGYRSAIIGKWHLGLTSPNTPLDRGFDHFHGFLGDMMDDYYVHRRHDINYMRHNRETIDPEGHASDLFSDWACDFLRQQKAGQPFCLYLAYNAPHTPIQPPEAWVEKVVARETGIDAKRAKLVALIEHMDDGIGRVLRTLRDAGLEQNTIVAFTSDNGGKLDVGANNGALRDGKQSMYEGGIKVAAAVAWPDRIRPGSYTRTRAMTMDVFPTLLEAAGVEIELEIDGVSFLPTLLGKEQPELRSHWFFRRREGGTRYAGKTIEAVRHGDWKLLQNSPFEPMELYNLRNDPQEQTNLIAKRPKKFQELAKALRAELQRYGRIPWQDAAGAPSHASQ